MSARRFIDVLPWIARQLELPPGVAGAVVYEVSRDGAADRAGLVPGDVVQRVNRRTVRTAADASRALAAVELGGSVFVLVWRAGGERLLQFATGKRDGPLRWSEARRSVGR
jgi:serine protease Do